MTQHGSPVIIADQDSPHSSALAAGLILPKDIAKEADAAKRKANTLKKANSPANEEPVMSILVSGADRKAYLMTDGEVAFETAIKIVDPSQPLGTHLFSLIGTSKTDTR